jgi:hypothetical protein
LRFQPRARARRLKTPYDDAAEDLQLKIGTHPARRAVEIREGPERKREGKPNHKSKIAVLRVPPGAVKDGRNELVLRSENVDTVILGIDVYVG